MGTLKLTGKVVFRSVGSRGNAKNYVSVCDCSRRTRTESVPIPAVGKTDFAVDQTRKKGDCSVIVFEKRVYVKRKSKQDLFSLTIHGCECFEKEMVKMAKIERVAVIVEAMLEEVCKELDQNCQSIRNA